MQEGTCRLCGIEGVLQVSHILPAFVFRWLKNTSGGIPLRNSKAPNRRVQDGVKLPFLCANCERSISELEKKFSDRLFRPHLADRAGTIRYSGWLNRFCVSISWRVLRYAIDLGQFSTWTQVAQTKVAEAEEVWRACLRGQRSNPGVFEQHLIPFGSISSADSELDPSINRYLLRDVDLDICRNDHMMFTYAKLGPIAIFGFLRTPQKTIWKGSKVHASEGLVEPRRYVLPIEMLNYLNFRSQSIGRAMRTISDRQQALINQTVLDRADSFIGSDAFAAIQADIALFGDAAFDDSARGGGAR